jgi:hypothetical protein
MSKRRIAVAAIAVTSAFCGGQLVVDQPPGHATEDGGYVLPDGAPAFVSGSGCESYTPSAQLANCADAQGCTYGLVCTSLTANDECAESARAILPPGYPFLTYCKSDPRSDPRPGDLRVCAFNEQIPGVSYCQYWQYVSATPFLACHTGPDGDAFCSAYLTQYVLGDGVASSKCVTACAPADDFDGVCATTTGAGYPAITPVGQPCGPAGDCEGLSMCVTRNGQSRCEMPCAPP